MKEIGAYEAKTRLSELLRKVGLGQEFMITNHGRCIARLVPVLKARKRAPSEVIQEILAFRVRKDCSHLDTKSMIEKGRR